MTWSYRHDLDSGHDLDPNPDLGRRAVLVGLTSRRFGCWHDGLGRVHVLTSVHAHMNWIVDAIKSKTQYRIR